MPRGEAWDETLRFSDDDDDDMGYGGSSSFDDDDDDEDGWGGSSKTGSGLWDEPEEAALEDEEAADAQ